MQVFSFWGVAPSPTKGLRPLETYFFIASSSAAENDAINELKGIAIVFRRL